MNFRALWASLALTALPAVALGHGMQMTFHVNGSSNLESDAVAYYGAVVDPAEHHDTVFLSGSYTLTGNPTVSALQFTASPATSNPPASNGIAISSTYGFDLRGPLLYWSPVSGFQPAPVSAVVVRSGVGYMVDQNTTFVAGGNLATTAAPYNGTAGFHNSTTVNIPLGSPAGLYAVGYQLRSTVNPNFPALPQYGTSNTFYAIGTNGLSDADFARGIAAFSAIGVPEPSGLALVVAGVVALVGALLSNRRIKFRANRTEART